MARIQKAVILAGSEHGWDQQQAMLPSLREIVTESEEFRRRR
jgi:hypothetical protein